MPSTPEAPRLSRARYIGGVGERGASIDVWNPLAANLRAQLENAASDAASHMRAVLSGTRVFGTDLAVDAAVLQAVTDAYAIIIKAGARAAASAAT